MLSGFFKNNIERLLSEKLNKIVEIKSFSNLSGGCINECYLLETIQGKFFFKWNDAKKYPNMFESEAKGLDLLHSTKTLKIPEVILHRETDGKSFLILEYIEQGRRQRSFWKDFGIKLAKLHQNSSPSFGGVGEASDNYIGFLSQSNKQHPTWIEFFIAERLQKQIDIAEKSGAVNNSVTKQFNNLFKRLPEVIPVEKPSLLHGDLWNGNYLIAADGSACLIDPAVYYGHREMDMAMTRLFGGFNEEFYEAYNESFPLAPGFESRVDIHNLYPLLVHMNLFGGGYLSQVKSILSRF